MNFFHLDYIVIYHKYIGIKILSNYFNLVYRCLFKILNLFQQHYNIPITIIIQVTNVHMNTSLLVGTTVIQLWRLYRSILICLSLNQRRTHILYFISLHFLVVWFGWFVLYSHFTSHCLCLDLLISQFQNLYLIEDVMMCLDLLRFCNSTKTNIAFHSKSTQMTITVIKSGFFKAQQGH